MSEYMPEKPVQRPKRRKNVYDILFGRYTGRFAIVAILASFMLPTEGVGVKICMMKNFFEVPCPGCGLTRSVTSISHLELTKAWNYHPFGLIIHPFLCFAALSVFLSIDARRRIRVWFWKHNRTSYAVYLTLIVGFLIFGFIRLGCALYGFEQLARVQLQNLIW